MAWLSNQLCSFTRLSSSALSVNVFGFGCWDKHAKYLNFVKTCIRAQNAGRTWSYLLLLWPMLWKAPIVSFQKQSVNLHGFFCSDLSCWMQLQLDNKHIWSFGQTEASNPAGNLFGAHCVESSAIVSRRLRTFCVLFSCNRLPARPFVSCTRLLTALIPGSWSVCSVRVMYVSVKPAVF